MRVVHLVGGELSSGAARGAYWQHRGLKELGVESSILTTSHETYADPDVVSLTATKAGRVGYALRGQVDNLAVLPYRRRQPRIFSTGLLGGKVSDHPLVREADVVNMHWVAKGPIGVGDWRRIKKPVVWTFRDMWPFTGGCHYSLGCDRYQHACGSCPQLGSAHNADLSRLVFLRKRRNLPERLVGVGISRWLSEMARSSGLLEGRRVETISNCVDTNLFRPIDRYSARTALGLDVDQPIVLIGAQALGDFYKGFELFLEAVGQMPADAFALVTFGRADSDLLAPINQPVLPLGFLGDNLSLRLVYSAADVFVAPSRMEAFGKTLVEAMACGTPVVAFDEGGPADIVSHQKTGYLAHPFDANDLARGIEWILSHREPERLSISARARAVESFGIRTVAAKYLELYQELVRS